MVKRMEVEGQVYSSNNYGDVIILEYINSYNVKIRFINTGYVTTTQMSNIRSGRVRDPYVPTVFGIGVLGDKYATCVNSKTVKEYLLWHSMLERCYSTLQHVKNPSYAGCTVSDNFKSYEYFYEWCHLQHGFSIEGWQLDKDLLVKGNKIYSENTCVFIPREINNALSNTGSSGKQYPLGVSKQGCSFIARLNGTDGRSVYLGRFNTPEEAFLAYKYHKEQYLEHLAYKWEPYIDTRAFYALLNYIVEISD